MSRIKQIQALNHQYLDRYTGDRPAALAVAEEDAATAREALRAWELLRGIYALAGALSVDPGRKAWHTLLDRYLAAAGGKVNRLLPRNAEPFFAFEALRAYLTYRGGKAAQAVERVTDLTGARPAWQYLEGWALGWLDEPTIRELGPEQVGDVLGTMVHTRYPDPPKVSAKQAAHLKRALKVCKNAERILGSDEKLSTIRLMILGKLGRFADAIRLARRAYAADPGWATAIGAANAMRRAGDVEGAAAMFRQAAEHNPEDVSALLDIGDLYLDRRRWKPALHAYEAALEREKDQAWALPSAYYCRYRLTGEKTWLTRLRKMANAAPDECGVADVLAHMFGGYSADDRRRRAQDLLGRMSRRSLGR